MFRQFAYPISARAFARSNNINVTNDFRVQRRSIDYAYRLPIYSIVAASICSNQSRNKESIREGLRENRIASREREREANKCNELQTEYNTTELDINSNVNFIRQHKRLPDTIINLNNINTIPIAKSYAVKRGGDD